MSGPLPPLPPPGPPPGQQPWPGPHALGPYPQHPGGPQTPWSAAPPPPAPGGGNRRWLLLGLAFLTVIALSVACTTWFNHRGSGNQAGSGGGGSQASGSASGGIASANDTGPVAIITEEPTCERLMTMQSQVSAQLLDWAKRDASVPESAWTTEQRQVFETSGRVFRAEADQLVPLARETPHRVMRELYEQIIAYDRAYADAIQHYTPADDELALLRNGLSTAQGGICQAITSFVAANRNPSVPAAAPPTEVAPVGDPANPQRFLTAPSASCPKLSALLDKEVTELELWVKTDPNIPASQRSATDNILYEAAGKVLIRGADERERIGRASGNPVMEDFLVLSAQYFRAYVAAIPTYVPADKQLFEVAQKSQVAVWDACKTVGG